MREPRTTNQAPLTPSPLHPFTPSPPHCVIAVARDAAFSFTYPETEELLQAAGARIVYFSPLAHDTLPDGAQGLILSGGFPELYAEALSKNIALHKNIRVAHAAGMPIYAECGGLMYLTENLVDQAGGIWPMVGLLPGSSIMTQRVVLGYRTARAVADSPLLPSGASIRGHEFHYSRWEGSSLSSAPAYELIGPDGTIVPEGARARNLLASYVHLHWLARPAMAERFVCYCMQNADR